VDRYACRKTDRYTVLSPRLLLVQGEERREEKRREEKRRGNKTREQETREGERKRFGFDAEFLGTWGKYRIR